ncbi:MAG: SEC-C metal-binding domain-containing protein [Oscillospiraceae bacterium]|nr:SEC-C metal-binding domain-containing protein [Oscillospiraceae bacterium]
MSLNKDWSDFVVNYVKSKGEDNFWKEYIRNETKIYTEFLKNYPDGDQGVLSELAKKYGVDDLFFVGFLDGINDSLKAELDIEALDKNTEINLDVDYEKLYYNMLDAKADYLYILPQWGSIFDIEKRKQITEKWRASKIIVKGPRQGRNDLCSCGSGKKYKNCCGKGNSE